MPMRPLLPPARRHSRPATARPLISDKADVRVDTHVGSAQERLEEKRIGFSSILHYKGSRRARASLPTVGGGFVGAGPDLVERWTGISIAYKRAPVSSKEE